MGGLELQRPRQKSTGCRSIAPNGCANIFLGGPNFLHAIAKPDDVHQLTSSIAQKSHKFVLPWLYRAKFTHV
jgi:hypothetical protein